MTRPDERTEHRLEAVPFVESRNDDQTFVARSGCADPLTEGFKRLGLAVHLAQLEKIKQQ